jgi:hypothetical protein
MKGTVSQPTPEMFKQRVPCATCPFRKDVAPHTPELQASYASYFVTLPGATFPCHKSVPQDDDRSTWSSWRDGQVLCVGGMIFAAKLGRTNAIMLYGIAQGWFDPTFTPDEQAVVHDSIDEMIGDKRGQK